jgi:hypothetical protein
VLPDNLPPPLPHRGVHTAKTALPHFHLGLKFTCITFMKSVSTSQKVSCVIITRMARTANAIRENNHLRCVRLRMSSFRRDFAWSCCYSYFYFVYPGGGNGFSEPGRCPRSVEITTIFKLSIGYLTTLSVSRLHSVGW